MNNLLNQHFPIFHTKEEIMHTIKNNERLSILWDKWKPEYREDFLNWCSGAKGMKVLYDSFFKEIMDPEFTPNRLSDMLSVLLNRKVTLKQILPVDSTRMGNEHSLVIMDIVVELDDGSLADIEVQKCGYQFPGQRASCYGSDLILRQYKRVRDRQGTTFRFGQIKPVYVIVLMETSRYFFHKNPDTYIYRFPDKDIKLATDLGLLENYLFIPLDNFKNRHHNKTIETKTDAWLTFLSTDEPETIVRLIDKYPEFHNMYETMFQMCQNIERVMDMFSKELEILDRNTVMGMIDEMDETIHNQSIKIQLQEETLSKQDEKLAEQDKLILENDKELAKKDKILAEKDEILAEKDEILAEKDEILAKKDEILAKKDEILIEKDEKIAEKDEKIRLLEEQLHKLKQQ